MGLELEEARVEKIKRRLAVSIGMDTIDACILDRSPTHTIRHRHHESLPLFHCHRRRHQLQKDKRFIAASRVCIAARRIRDESPQDLIAGVDLLLAPAQRYSLGMCADLVIDQCSPELRVIGCVFVRGGDSGDVVVANVLISIAVIGEAFEFGGSIESGGRGVAGLGIGSVVEAIARPWHRALAKLCGFDGDVARAGLDGAFEVGGGVTFDAEVDYV